MKDYCYECDPDRKGGYNHKKCRHGKVSKTGKKQKCSCWCRGSKYYNVKLSRLKP